MNCMTIQNKRVLVVSNLVSATITALTVLWTRNPNNSIINAFSYSFEAERNTSRDLEENCCSCPWQPSSTINYTTIDDPDWPYDSIWQSELGAILSTDARLFNNMNIGEDRYYELCPEDDDDKPGYSFMLEGNGLCMIEENCRYRFCNRDGQEVNGLPAYTVDVRTPEDIQSAISFANKYNIQITVKNTGHNYVGASVMPNSLNIWMIHYPKDGTINENFQDSCGTPAVTVGIAGGELTNDVLNVVKADYTLLTGDHRSTGYAGFIMGVGVGYTSRLHGAGVDLVMRFDVILPNSTEVVADACSNPDLFWALRGGGGGTFGVVTHMDMKLLPATGQITEVYFNLWEKTRENVRKFMEFWTKVSPKADRRVMGGYWLAFKFVLYIQGDEDAAREVLADDLESWFNENLNDDDGEWGFESFSSWYDIRDGDEGYVEKDDDNPVGDGAGDKISTRLVPLDFIEENTTKMIDFLTDLYFDVEKWDAYYFGGAMSDVAQNKTAVHPAMRTSPWAISTTTRVGHQLVRELLPNSIGAGASYNHHSPEEPDWRNALWGENYDRLLSIKKDVDPHHRFNCWHCVGYQGEEYEFS
mmetsp:Transcript_13776/g.21279  ORF Transcript_13776/g.21279 Transcript_13776/m.21279 type:complete len:586 (-) Transcript_13776:131-1888(-)